ncbi:MAG: hypothetical protein LBN21_01735 [Treponema sp.]|jgi:hypothetical protein|nr:hypothetical protein [Treponema sp.]
MKKNRIAKIISPLLLLFLFIMVSCNQDAIFYAISQETEPKDPRIPGTPTNIVEFNNAIFAASSSLHRYAKRDADNNGIADNEPGPVWDASSDDNPLKQPGFRISALAATTEYLYALSLNDSGYGDVLKRIKKGNGLGSLAGDWETVSIDTTDSGAAGYPNFQTLCADSDRLFVGARSSGDSYAILYADDTAVASNGVTNNLRLLISETGVLSGAAFDGTTHYVSGSGNYGGIFTVSEADLGSKITSGVTGSPQNSRNIMGMIAVTDNSSNTQIVAITRNGDLLYLNAGDTDFTALKNVGYSTTGSLAVWKAAGGAAANSLLLIGIQGSLTSLTQTYTNGYREAALESGGSLSTVSDNAPIYDPGNPASGKDTSVASNDRYASAVGLHPINFLYQVPAAIDDTMPVFASTQNYGLWSCRDKQWNAEE